MIHSFSFSFYFRERESAKYQFVVHLFMHSLVASCMYPNLESNSQPWHIRPMLQPTPWAGPIHSSTEMFFLIIVINSKFCRYRSGSFPHK